MKEYKKQMLIFPDISNKKVEVDFNGGETTSDSGLIFLSEVENQIGIVNSISKVIPDSRHPSYIEHEYDTLLRQRVFQIASGYEDGNDCDSLRKDPAFKYSCNKLPSTGSDLGSQPTMSRLENTPSRTVLYRIGLKFVDSFVDSYETPPEGIILDIDDTCDPAYGNQQMTLFNGYHGTKCYMPIHIYEGKSGKLITAILRPGKRPNGKEVVSIIKRIIKRIRESWPDVGIILRGDSHYSSPVVHDWCEENNVKFVIGLTSNAILWQKANSIMEKAKEFYCKTEKPVKLYSEFQYQAKSWSKPRRIIVKAEYNHNGSNTRFIVTNLKHAKRKFVYQTAFCGRGNMELFIKEHKNHLSSDRTSCSSFNANQFRLFLHSAAYVLLHTFRAKHLKSTEFAKAQFNTIRTKLLKVGAQVRELITKVKFHLSASFPYKNIYKHIWKSLCLDTY